MRNPNRLIRDELQGTSKARFVGAPNAAVVPFSEMLWSCPNR
jgi:hypothetical protein